MRAIRGLRYISQPKIRPSCIRQASVANLLVRNGEVRPASVAALYVEFLDAVIAAEDEWIRKRASQTV
jgi:hypothetical protein